jgi:hypothetical protein
MARRHPRSPQGSGDGQLERIRELLLGIRLTRGSVEKRGLSPRDKGKWGKAIEALLGISPNSSPLPDLGPDGELKTTVLDRAGRFRESIRICMAQHDPLVKLARIVLVIARDLNDASSIEDREVVVEDVLVLHPTELIHHVLEADRDLLRRDLRSKDTYFLETRTAGARGATTRAYYLKKTRVQEYVDEIVRATTFRRIRNCLLRLHVGPRQLRDYSPSNKGRFGMYVQARLPPDLRPGVRTGVIRLDGNAKEDLLVCPETENPVHALRSLVYVPMRVTRAPGTAGESRYVADVVYLAPNGLVVHALRRDRALARRHRGKQTLFLRLKTRYFGAERQWSWYLKANAVARYTAIVRNQPG